MLYVPVNSPNKLSNIPSYVTTFINFTRVRVEIGHVVSYLITRILFCIFD